jgi:hypothetical protein
VSNTEPPVIPYFRYFSRILDFYINLDIVSEPKVLSSNFESVIYLTFQLNISRVGHHLLKRSLNPSVQILFDRFFSFWCFSL